LTQAFDLKKIHIFGKPLEMCIFEKEFAFIHSKLDFILIYLSFSKISIEA